MLFLIIIQDYVQIKNDLENKKDRKFWYRILILVWKFIVRFKYLFLRQRYLKSKKRILF